MKYFLTQELFTTSSTRDLCTFIGFMVWRAFETLGDEEITSMKAIEQDIGETIRRKNRGSEEARRRINRFAIRRSRRKITHSGELSHSDRVSSLYSPSIQLPKLAGSECRRSLSKLKRLRLGRAECNVGDCGTWRCSETADDSQIARSRDPKEALQQKIRVRDQETANWP